MGERSILSYFSSSKQANSAKDELLAMGFEIAQVDQFGHAPGSGLTEEPMNSLSGEVSSNASLVEGVELTNDDGQLLMSDPAVSGMAGTDHVRGRSFILTVVTDDDHVDQAVKVIKQYRGYV